MTSVELYGHSDDLIEVEGDAREEFYANFDEPTQVRVEDYLLEFTYDGQWHIDIVEAPERPTYTQWPPTELGHNDYSDVVKIHGLPADPTIEKVE